MQVVCIAVCDRLFHGYISWQAAEARGVHHLIQFTCTHAHLDLHPATHIAAQLTHISWLTLSAAFARIVVGHSHTRPQLRSVSRCNRCFFPHTKPLNPVSASAIQFVTKQQTAGLRWVRPEKIVSRYPRDPRVRSLLGSCVREEWLGRFLTGSEVKASSGQTSQEQRSDSSLKVMVVLACPRVRVVSR